MPIVWFFVAFFGVYFVISAIRALLRGTAYALGWLWGYADSYLEGKPLRALVALAVPVGALVLLTGR